MKRKKKGWSRQPRQRQEEEAQAREVYERDRAKRDLRLVPQPRKRRARSEEYQWAAQSGPVRVRKGEA